MKVLQKIRLQAKARSNYYEMQDESSLKNIDALVLYFVYGSRDEFQEARVEIGQDMSLLGSLLSQMFFQSSLFLYAHV